MFIAKIMTLFQKTQSNHNYFFLLGIKNVVNRAESIKKSFPNFLPFSRSFLFIFECPEDKSALAVKNIASLYIFRSFLFIFQNKWLYSPVYYYIRG